ncbi:MAG TPA: DALR anticodon-binding domain-containing protein, partial [Terriglobales bacterium]|nr:DALR anticodon-binding domain-containing protein [Terriglobales bacterium]
PEMPEPELRAAAHAIAIGALRYFLLKFTRATLIAFDFKEALNFEGETGPYVQYAAVRAANIVRKSGAPPAAAFDPAWAAYLDQPAHWNLLWLAARLEAVVEQSLEAREPAILAKYAFQLAQAFNAWYHHHPVLQEPDAAKRAFLLSAVAVVERQLTATLDLMGVSVPNAM